MAENKTETSYREPPVKEPVCGLPLLIHAFVLAAQAGILLLDKTETPTKTTD